MPTTFRALVFPVAGSVANTSSPTSTFPIGLLEPSAINTRVPGTKLFTRHARPTSCTVSAASATFSAAFTTFAPGTNPTASHAHADASPPKQSAASATGVSSQTNSTIHKR